MTDHEHQYYNPECQAEMVRVGVKEFIRMMSDSRAYTPEEIIDRVLNVALWALDLAEAKAHGMTDWHGDIAETIAAPDSRPGRMMTVKKKNNASHWSEAADSKRARASLGEFQANFEKADEMIADDLADRAAEETKYTSTQTVDTKPPPPSGKFDKAAYQREYMKSYMRKRRAAAKLTGTP